MKYIYTRKQFMVTRRTEEMLQIKSSRAVTGFGLQKLKSLLPGHF